MWGAKKAVILPRLYVVVFGYSFDEIEKAHPDVPCAACFDDGRLTDSQEEP